MSFCSWAIILAMKKNLKTLYDQMRALNDLSCGKLVLLFLRLNSIFYPSSREKLRFLGMEMLCIVLILLHH